MGVLISHQRLLEIVAYDQISGVFTSRVSRQGLRHRVLGHVEKNGYRRLMIEGQRYLAHRLAWFYVVGEWPRCDVDHKNLSRDDNAFNNLRLATDSQNHANTSPPKNNTSGLKGAHFNRFRDYWQSYIKVNGKSIYLGRFNSKYAAHEAYVRAAAKYFDEFARAA